MYNYNFYYLSRMYQNAAVSDDISEIQSFLNHKDYSLAVRRLLDKSLDVGNESLIEEAIDCSRAFNNLQQQADMPGDFVQKATQLLQKLPANSTVFQPGLLLRAEEISKTYSRGGFSLKSISLQINTGSILGIVGENGNGKTTLLRCLAAQLMVNGKISYHGIGQTDHYGIKHQVAFIPQRIPRWYGYLKDNLHFSAAIYGITGHRNKLMVDFMLERLNLTAYAHLTWQQISSGYRTRFEIARILLQQPDLLILDEPLANLDINAQQTLLTDLRYLAKSVHHPMGIVLSSQQLHEVEKAADKVLLIKNGNCIYTTNKEEENTANGYAVEIETTAERDVLSGLFSNNISLHYNGGFYTLVSAEYTPEQILEKLVANNIAIKYYRDITNSTKRYF
jgi:ABC-2 type transport system ATP-binding protein